MLSNLRVHLGWSMRSPGELMRLKPGLFLIPQRPEPQTVATVNTVSDPIDQLSATRRLAEVAEILAAGILRLRAAGSAATSRRAGPTGLPAQAKHAC